MTSLTRCEVRCHLRRFLHRRYDSGERPRLARCFGRDFVAKPARRAYTAVWRLAESADETVPFLRRHLRPIPEPDAKHVRRLIDDLDSNDFVVREKASAELAKLGELAAPALHAALAGKPALEVRRRVEKLLEQLARPISLPEKLRGARL